MSISFNARKPHWSEPSGSLIGGQLNTYDYQKRCAKCRKHKPTAGGHQRVVPGKGVYFVCADCKPFMEASGEIRPR